MVIPFEIHIPPVEDLLKAFHRGSEILKCIGIPGEIPCTPIGGTFHVLRMEDLL